MELIEQWPLVLQVLAFVAAFNIALSGLKAALDLIKDKTATQVDNKAAEFIGKIAVLLGKALDVIGYNKKH
jgi:hypothetical protein